MTQEIDIAVVGAGPAGLSAAAEAARLGAEVVLFDDNARPGGQYFRQAPEGFAAAATARTAKDRARLEALLAGIDSPRVSYRPGMTVWNLPDPLTLAFAGEAGAGRVRARAVVVATGARDRTVPFPGWTLPGVMTAGGLQNLVKGSGIVPPGPVVVAGTGPLLLVAAASLVRAGVEVAAVVEAARPARRSLSNAADLVQAPATLALGLSYRAALLGARVRVLEGRCVVAAHGDASLVAVDMAPIDARGRIDAAQTRPIEARTLVTGFGLAPSLELAQLADAECAVLPLRGGATLVRNDRLMTTVPGLFAAGDGAAIGGVELALLEGRICGIEAAVHAGCVRRDAVAILLDTATARHWRLARFRRGLERVFAPPADWDGLLTPETIVCRCEDVTARDIEALMAQGLTSALQLKPATRIGMGRCQGRNCLHTLAAIIARRQGIALDEVSMPRPRPPARPVPLAHLVAEDLPPPDLPDDPHLPRRR